MANGIYNLSDLMVEALIASASTEDNSLGLKSGTTVNALARRGLAVKKGGDSYHWQHVLTADGVAERDRIMARNAEIAGNQAAHNVLGGATEDHKLSATMKDALIAWLPEDDAPLTVYPCGTVTMGALKKRGLVASAGTRDGRPTWALTEEGRDVAQDLTLDAAGMAMEERVAQEPTARCCCEHVSHFADDAKQPSAGHRYEGVQAGTRRHPAVGPICDECADGCLAAEALRDSRDDELAAVIPAGTPELGFLLPWADPDNELWGQAEAVADMAQAATGAIDRGSVAWKRLAFDAYEGLRQEAADAAKVTPVTAGAVSALDASPATVAVFQAASSLRVKRPVGKRKGPRPQRHNSGRRGR